MSFEAERERMVEEQIRARGITDQRLLDAFLAVPRHLFVPREFQASAYADHPLPIGAGQTISQPYITALMTSLLRLQGHERVLDIGAGSGYQTAILATLALEVYAIERLPELMEALRQRLHDAGLLNVHLKVGDGTLGWPDHAPYDAILIAASAPEIPAPLLDQLADHGRLIMPVGDEQGQTLVEVDRRGTTLSRKTIVGCMFVPLIGRFGWPGEPG